MFTYALLPNTKAKFENVQNWNIRGEMVWVTTLYKDETKNGTIS
jgi:hypothetical protein